MGLIFFTLILLSLASGPCSFRPFLFVLQVAVGCWIPSVNSLAFVDFPAHQGQMPTACLTLKFFLTFVSLMLPLSDFRPHCYTLLIDANISCFNEKIKYVRKGSRKKYTAFCCDISLHLCLCLCLSVCVSVYHLCVPPPSLFSTLLLLSLVFSMIHLQCRMKSYGHHNISSPDAYHSNCE